jgi:hypothetical protein
MVIIGVPTIVKLKSHPVFWPVPFFLYATRKAGGRARLTSIVRKKSNVKRGGIGE